MAEIRGLRTQLNITDDARLSVKIMQHGEIIASDYIDLGPAISEIVQREVDKILKRN